MRPSAPKGYSSVSPYLVVDEVEKELAFLQAVFDAQIKQRLRNDSGDVWHGEAEIGGSTVMLGRASKEHPAFPSMVYVWVEDVDAAYQVALKNGAQSVSEPADQFYGNREAGVRDLQGNTWWIAREIGRLSNAEVERRLAKQRRDRM
jgi:PhnB protein